MPLASSALALRAISPTFLLRDTGNTSRLAICRWRYELTIAQIKYRVPHVLSTAG